MKRIYPEKLLGNWLYFVIYGILFLTVRSIYAQSPNCDSVSWCNPRGSGNNLMSIKFAGKSIAYAAGEDGAVLKSFDGGSTWRLLRTGSADFLVILFTVDETTVYAAGNGGAVIKTTDGGNSWTSASNGIKRSARISTLSFTSADTGYAAGVDASGAALYKTVDGGKSWAGLNTSFIPSSTYPAIYSICFPTADIGYVVLPYAGVFKTTDGGASFFRLTDAPDARYYTVTFVDKYMGFFGGEDKLGGAPFIAKTSDGGNNWGIAVINAPETVHISAIDMPVRDTGYALATSTRSYILKTTTGGYSWEVVNSSDGPIYVRNYEGIDFVSVTHGAVAGGSGVIKVSHNGQTFDDVSAITRSTMHGVHFGSPKVGYAAGEGGEVLRTRDRGTTWEKLQVDGAKYNYFEGIHFQSESVGFAYGGWDSCIFNTRDGGQTWKATNTGVPRLRSLHFSPSGQGYAGGSEGKLITTTDLGFAWKPLASPTLDEVCAVYFPAADTGYVLSSSDTVSVVWKTVNGGGSWTKVYTTGNSLHTLFFQNANRGYAGASGGSIITTTDGGKSWQTVTTGNPSFYVSSIAFADENLGLATLDSVSYGLDVINSWGAVLKTTDGGKTWTRFNNKIYPGLNSITFADPVTAFAAGFDGALFRFELGRPLSAESISGPGSVCTAMESYSIDCYSAQDFLWSLSGGGTISGSGKQISVQWTTEGTYVLSVTPVNDCGKGKTISLIVCVNTSVPVVLDSIAGQAAPCLNSKECYRAPVITGVTYDWSLSAGGELEICCDSVTVTWKHEGLYYLTAIPKNGCGVGNPLKFEAALEHVLLPMVTKDGNVLTASEGKSYQWYLDGKPVTGATSSTYVAQVAGSYTAEVSTNGRCWRSSDPVPVSNITAIAGNTLKEKFSVYPNPAKGFVTIASPPDGQYDVRVVSALGETVASRRGLAGESAIELEGFLKGVYFIQLQSAEGVGVEKIVLE